MTLFLLVIGFAVSIGLAFLAGYQLHKDKLGDEE
jgi:hypothetical protein|tara:strand:+ start:9710 stop:9811 length:102 start_codon:yes stop_codon:yes gene_type:complete